MKRNSQEKLKDFKDGKCTQCRSKAANICCKQEKTITTFKSHQTNKTWKIFHKTNCNCKPFVLRSYGVFNMQPKYVSKNKTPLDLSIIRFINYRKELKDPKAILSDKHCQK